VMVTPPWQGALIRPGGAARALRKGGLIWMIGT
jgi:hypothetical protein